MNTTLNKAIETLELTATVFGTKGPEDVEKKITFAPETPWSEVSDMAIKAFKGLRLVSGAIYAFKDGVKVARFSDGF